MEKKRGEGNKDFKKGKLGQGVGALKGGGAGTPLQTMPSVFTLYFKFLRCLKVYKIATATFSSQILMYSPKPSPHPTLLTVRIR